MKILIDNQTFNEQKFGGISRYYTEILIFLKKKKDVNLIFPLYYTDNLHLKESSLVKNTLSSFSESVFFPKFIKRKIIKKSRRRNYRLVEKKIKKNQFDVFIPTYYDDYFLTKLNGKPFVLTVYDMIHELFPQYFEKDLYTLKNKKLLIEKATKIIAISESTKRDILKVYPYIDEAKIEIVYLSQSIKNEVIVNLELPNKYILFVGNRSIYKNFIFFLKAVAPLLNEDPELFVVCAGGNKFEDEEIELINELSVSNQVIQNNFEDNQLASYYKNAACFVFPSEYEGFGIPVLEAMVCGCPVVLANHSSFPEVAGDAGCYFELNNELDLKNKVEELLTNGSKRQEFIELGYLQANKFSWEKTANDCLEVYKKAIQ